MKKLITSSIIITVIITGCTTGKNLTSVRNDMIKNDTADYFGIPAVAVTESTINPSSGATDQKTEELDIGAIGDVKYSVLKPEDFKKENGFGWELLGGQTLDQNWEITTKYPSIFQFPSDHLPDARGVFLRGMNMTRDKISGNPNGQVPMGKFESDSLKSHQHTFSTSGPTSFYTKNGGEHPSGSEFYTPSKTDPFGGSETRPRHISLYLYIKVDHLPKNKKL